MDVPKPHPPKTIAQKLAELPENQIVQPGVTVSTTPKPPFVRKPHLTDRPFRDLKTQLDSK